MSSLFLEELKAIATNRGYVLSEDSSSDSNLIIPVLNSKGKVTYMCTPIILSENKLNGEF